MRGLVLDTRKILQRLYPRQARAHQRSAHPRRSASTLQRRLWQIGLVLGACLAWVAAHVYYFNVLVDLDTNVQEGWAQVEAQLNRRYNIQRNITLLVMAYGKHERELHLRVTQIRTEHDEKEKGRAKQDGAAAGETERARSGAEAAVRVPLEKMGRQELNRIFPQIKLLAEQYPQLRLSENFQQFSKAVVETEDKIAKQIMAYNTTVNRMTTALRQVPGNVFGRVCGFKLSDYSYHLPERTTLPFQPVDYGGK